MGRWYCHKKSTVQRSLDLTVFQLKKYGMLKAGYHTAKVITWASSSSGEESSVNVEVKLLDDPHIRIEYALNDQNGNLSNYENEISLITTQCNLGGVRYWFACPVCFRRVGGIYLAPGNSYFMCRHCSNLTYYSRNESSLFAFLGITDRKITKLKSEIKRWTWRGRPTRKVQKLNKLQRKEGALLSLTSIRIENMNNRIKDANP